MYLSEKVTHCKVILECLQRSHPLQRRFLLISSDFLKYPSLLCCVFQGHGAGSMMAHHGLKNSDSFTKTIQAVPTDGCPHHHVPEVTQKCRYILYLRGPSGVQSRIIT